MTMFGISGDLQIKSNPYLFPLFDYVIATIVQNPHFNSLKIFKPYGMKAFAHLSKKFKLVFGTQQVRPNHRGHNKDFVCSLVGVTWDGFVCSLVGLTWEWFCLLTSGFNLGMVLFAH